MILENLALIPRLCKNGNYKERIMKHDEGIENYILTRLRNLAHRIRVGGLCGASYLAATALNARIRIEQSLAPFAATNPHQTGRR